MKRLGVLFIIIMMFVGLTCQTPTRTSRQRKVNKFYVDTVYDGKGNVIAIKKHSEKNEHRDTYYYTIFTLALMTLLIIYSNSKR
jgi:hypothetical protein